MERWKPIAGYEGLYKVSDKGRVVGVKSGRILKPGCTNCGYFQVILCKPGLAKLHFSVHRLVAEAFVPNPLNKSEVNHINENKLDNRACNLEWCTHSENINWGTRNERIAKTLSKPVAQLDADGNQIATFYSAGEAERKTGVRHGNICHCCLSRSKTAGGYKWMYV